MTTSKQLRILLCGVAAWPATAAADLERAGSELQINSTTLIAAEIFPSVAALPSGDFVVTWSENIDFGSTNGLRAEVMARRFASNGAAFGTEFQVNTFTTGDQGWPVVDAWSDGFVFAWESDPMNGEGPQFGGLRLYNGTGVAMSEELRFSPVANDPVIATDPDGGFVIAWGGDPESLVRRFDRQGMPRGMARAIVDEPADYYTYTGVGALAGGNAAVVFAQNSRVFVRLLGPTGAPLGPPFRVSGALRGRDPEIVGDPCGGFVVVWTYSDRRFVGRRFDDDGVPVGEEFPLTYDPARGASSVFPGPRAIAMGPHGDLLVVWDTDGDGSEAGITAQHIDRAGRPVGVPIRVNTTTIGPQVRPAAAADQTGGYIVVWTDRPLGPPSAPAIRGQRLVLSSGAPEVCDADCDHNGQVDSRDLDVGVRMVFNDHALCRCPVFDTEGDGRVTAADLIRAIGIAVDGCPIEPNRFALQNRML